MVDYAKLYHLMVNAAENAIGAIDAQNYGAAKDILICAEQEAEELYIETVEDGEQPTYASAKQDTFTGYPRQIQGQNK